MPNINLQRTDPTAAARGAVKPAVFGVSTIQKGILDGVSKSLNVKGQGKQALANALFGFGNAVANFGQVIGAIKGEAAQEMMRRDTVMDMTALSLYLQQKGDEFIKNFKKENVFDNESDMLRALIPKLEGHLNDIVSNVFSTKEPEDPLMPRIRHTEELGITKDHAAVEALVHGAAQGITSSVMKQFSAEQMQRDATVEATYELQQVNGCDVSEESYKNILTHMNGVYINKARAQEATDELFQKIRWNKFNTDRGKYLEDAGQKISEEYTALVEQKQMPRDMAMHIAIQHYLNGAQYVDDRDNLNALLKDPERGSENEKTFDQLNKTAAQALLKTINSAKKDISDQDWATVFAAVCNNNVMPDGSEAQTNSRDSGLLSAIQQLYMDGDLLKEVDGVLGKKATPTQKLQMADVAGTLHWAMYTAVSEYPDEDKDLRMHVALRGQDGITEYVGTADDIYNALMSEIADVQTTNLSALEQLRNIAVAAIKLPESKRRLICEAIKDKIRFRNDVSLGKASQNTLDEVGTYVFDQLKKNNIPIPKDSTLISKLSPEYQALARSLVKKLMSTPRTGQNGVDLWESVCSSAITVFNMSPEQKEKLNNYSTRAIRASWDEQEGKPVDGVWYDLDPDKTYKIEGGDSKFFYDPSAPHIFIETGVATGAQLNRIANDKNNTIGADNLLANSPHVARVRKANKQNDERTKQNFESAGY